MADTAKVYYFTQFLMIAALCGIVQLGLLPAFLAGLLIYNFVDLGSRMLQRRGVVPGMGKILLLVLLALLVVSGIVFASLQVASYLTTGKESLFSLFQRMADVVERGRSLLPEWAQVFFPADTAAWQAASSEWLRENASRLSLAGRDAGIFIVRLIIGMIIGGMVAINPPQNKELRGALGTALKDRMMFLGKAFRRVVFSQFRISALNTCLTGIFLAIIMPMIGQPLPMVHVMVAVTFIVGLLPIVGNLISNTVICLIGLSVSPFAAIACLAYLVLIHKLEYFVNARIIGGQIRARAWEILIAMLVMETAFGLSGLVAAAIYYAYLKDELTAQKLI
ncbi:MAG: AI-2E family transporter [Alphaproteobacteria bacterium]